MLKFAISELEKTMLMDESMATYFLGEDNGSGLEFRLLSMPQFFLDNGDNPVEPHRHDFYQIIWFKRGHGTHHVDFVDYEVSDNTIFFISPGQVHAFDGNTAMEGEIIQFNAAFMSDELSSESIFLKYAVFNAFDSAPCCNVTVQEAERLRGLVEEMRREYSLVNAFAHKDYMQALIRLFLIRAQRSGERRDAGRLYVTSIANLVFVRFRQLLEQNYMRVHTVKEYARMLNVSTRAFSDYVRQSSHRTPLQIINDRIVLEAKRKIQHSSLKIKEIAYSLGFDDPSIS